MNTAAFIAEPTLVWSPPDVLTTDRYKAIADKYAPATCYIKTDTLVYNRPIGWRGKLHTFVPAPVWVSGHSDFGITTDIYDRYKHNCKIWFALNKEVDASNVFALPLGRTNYCNDSPIHLIFGDNDIMYKAAKEPKNIVNSVYMNFSINTYPVERQGVYTMFKDKPWVTVGETDMTYQGAENYLRTLRNHTFALCPRGNGLDTHRLWESLYVGTIPIVRRHFGLKEFADLPICWVDTWDQVTPEFLESEYTRILATTWNLEKLKIGFWESYIREKMKGAANKQTA